MANDNAVYWLSHVGETDDFGKPYKDVMYDGKTKQWGSWANMNGSSWKTHGVGKLGTGYGQKYKRQPDGRWLKVEG
jgi:hypothetical protein